MKRIIKSVKNQIVKLGQQLYPYKDIIQWVDKNSKSYKDTKFYTLVHVGAHLGQEAPAYEKLNIQNVVWVEADPKTFELLQENLKKRTESQTIHKAFNCLLTSQDNLEYQFHVFSNQGASSSIFKSTNLLKKNWSDVHETGEIFNLNSITLDSLLSQNNISPDLLLIDVQGSELEVLKGAHRTLTRTRIKAIELEVSKQAIYEGGCLYDEIDSFLTLHGFSRMSFVPWHGNVLYVRDPKKLDLFKVKVADLFVGLLTMLQYLTRNLSLFRN
jgi:FkbM family methyltransferase